MYNFEKLRVYHSGLLLVEEIYLLTKSFPRDELFALTNQLKRSSASVVLNIAEGKGSLGEKEFSNFLRIALKSLYETVAGLKIAEKLFNVKIDNCLEIADTAGKELNALINKLKYSY